MKFLKKTILLAAILSLVSAPGVAGAARISGDTRSPAVSGQDDPGNTASVKEDEALKKKPSSRADRNTAAKKGKKEAAAKNGRQSPEAKYVTIDFDNVDIAVFVKFMSEVTGKNFVIDNNVKGKVTIYSPKQISIDEAYKVFESVLEVHGFSTVPAGDIIKIVPAKDAREKNIETRLAGEAAGPTDKIVTQIVSLNHANPDEMKKVLDPLISRSSVILSYPPTGMLVITDYLSNIKRLQIIISSLDVAGAAEQISVIPVKNAAAAEVARNLTTIFQGEAQAQRRGPATSTMRVIADERTNCVILIANQGLTQRIRQLITLLDRDIPRGESNMNVYRLQNANAEDLAKILMSLPRETKAAGAPGGTEKGKAPVLSKDITILADKATNSLIITANRDDFKVLSDVIAKLDVARTMVYIEALIMEVSVTKNFQLGVQWRTAQDIGKAPGSTDGRIGYIAGSGGPGSGGSYSNFPDITYNSTVGALTAAFPAGFSLGVMGAGIKIGNVYFPSIGAVIEAMHQDQDIHILSTPQLLTLDNEEAEINVGKNVPYQVRAETTQAQIDYSTYEYKDVGVKLNITPHINDDQFVRLKIQQSVTQLTSTDASIKTPTTFKREAKTTVVVKDSDTIVIGGIIGDNTQFNEYKVPCLGSIPLLGWLFKSVQQTREKTNLFIFITPRIIRTKQDIEPVTKGKRELIESIREEATIKLFDREERDGKAQQGTKAPAPQAAPQPAPQSAVNPAAGDKKDPAK